MTTRTTAPFLALAGLLVLGASACSPTKGHAVPPAPGAPSGASAPGSPASGSAPTAPTAAGSSSATDGASASQSPSTTPGPSVIPAPAAPLRTVRTPPIDGTSYVVKIWAQRKDASCADHAYGAPMIKFLNAHACRGMTRELATTTVDGRGVGMSIVTTSFPGTPKHPYAVTASFRQLVDKNGTGSISDLLREGYRLPSGPTKVPSPDAFNELGQDSGVSVYDVWYLQGRTPTNDKKLVAMTYDIFLQF